MNSHKNKVALIVHSCDRYQFLFKGFEIFFLKHWDFTINCNYYFATEEKEVVVQGFENILSGKGEWSDRLAWLLKNKIREQYVLYFQEDMWLSKKVNPLFFNQLFTMAEQNYWPQVKLHSAGVYKTINTETFIQGFNIANIDNVQSNYLMSHQVTLWQKEFLLKQLFAKEHPWRNERRGTKRLKKINPAIKHVDYFAENGHEEINENENPALRSEYFAVSINATLKNNVEPFISELLMGNSYEQGYAAKLQYNYNNNLTHDGLHKPRKTGIFKRIKNWMKS